MPKQRITCTRCSQRRQKCDRKTPCSRCIQNKEAHLCTTHWAEGYNPAVHRRYPKKPSPTAERSTGGSSDTSSTLNQSPPASSVTKGSSNDTHLNPADPVTGAAINFGHSGLLDLTIGSLLNDKDVPGPNPALFDQSLKYVRSAGKQIDEPIRVTSFCSPAAKIAETQHIQSLLPCKDMVLKITDYYYENMLYWIGGMYHGPTFRRELLEAYGPTSNLDLQKLDWRWTALLFAIMSSSLIASPEALSESWGFSIADKVRCSREWGAASVSSLNLGNYTSRYHIRSVQAIYILHAYEHLVGSTNQWIALRSIASVIARGLGLHKLGPHPDDAKVMTLRGDQKQAYINREIGRRTWSTIASQEWLCSTSQQAYTAGEP
ncbi:hypothetical protein BKA63DRAFT_488811 [Paraphoma chrysanthemicola]|nr:hypothetical protein BKA63DRAFT_488811 [Paraphoma chrysanthemicola]